MLVPERKLISQVSEKKTQGNQVSMSRQTDVQPQGVHLMIGVQ